MHGVQGKGLSQKAKGGDIGIVKIGQADKKDPRQVIDTLLFVEATNGEEEDCIQKNQVGFVREKVL
jgi:hypothetical protein